MQSIWFFSRRSTLLTILDVRGEGYDEELSNLISSAVTIIEIAQLFNGRLTQDVPIENTKAHIAVHFSLVFRNDEDLNNYIKVLNLE